MISQKLLVHVARGLQVYSSLSLKDLVIYLSIILYFYIYNEITFFLFLFSGEFLMRYGLDFFFLKVPPNFCLSSGTREIWTTRLEESGKTEKLNFNKFAENRDIAKRKR